MRAWLNLRYTDDKRARLFMDGLKKLGYFPEFGRPKNSGPGDIYVTWNRVGIANQIADEFTRTGRQVLVVENASWGNYFANNAWYHMARRYHNTASCFDVFNFDRWQSLNVDLKPFKTGSDKLILVQRGIGSDPVRMPPDWPRKALKKHGGRIRKHPGRFQPKVTLLDDLKGCGQVITWGSGAAIKALIEGYPVVSDMPNWIGEQDNTEAGRLAMFSRLSWAQWTHEEIESGFAFDCLLNS